jgi:hypothetical protein
MTRRGFCFSFDFDFDFALDFFVVGFRLDFAAVPKSNNVLPVPALFTRFTCFTLCEEPAVRGCSVGFT